MTQQTIVVAEKWHDENRKGSGDPRSSRQTKHMWSGLVTSCLANSKRGEYMAKEQAMLE